MNDSEKSLATALAKGEVRRSEMVLTGKVAIVTGAGGSGCGGAIACRLAREGASIVIADLREAGMRETASAIEAEGRRASILRTDVGNEAEVRALFAFAENTHGGVDILVNDASAAVFPEKSLDDWFANLRVDLLGAMYATRYGIEAMRRRGGGAIVNIDRLRINANSCGFPRGPSRETTERPAASRGPPLLPGRWRCDRRSFGACSAASQRLGYSRTARRLTLPQVRRVVSGLGRVAGTWTTWSSCSPYP